MPTKQDARYTLTSFGLSSPVSYEVRGEQIIGRLFGLFPVIRVHLGAVYYLRLASASDASPVFLCFNWIHFMAHKRSRRPVYVLQTRSHHRILLKLDSATHFKLRQAIARHAPKPSMHMAA